MKKLLFFVFIIFLLFYCDKLIPTDKDSDKDGIEDNIDNCPDISNEEQDDLDDDDIGDACDDDIDGDEVLNEVDNCPAVSNEGQADIDGDGIGDACADDIDGDGIINADDNCPEISNESQNDMDGDGIGDACDDDIDGDGILNDDDHSIIISPTGGEYTFPDGIKLRVPAGAVAVDTEIELTKIDNSELIAIFAERGVPIDNLLACIEGKPDGLSFNVPVELILSVDLEPGDLSLVHEINIDNGTYSLAETEISCDPDEDTISFTLTHFSWNIIEKLVDLIKHFGDDPCRVKKYFAKQKDSDASSASCNEGECQVQESSLEISYLDCVPPQTDYNIIREVSPGCKPSLELSAANTTITTNSQTDITAQVKLGCMAKEGQGIEFSVVGPAGLTPAVSVTDDNGNAISTLISGDDGGTAEVTAKTSFSYYNTMVYASAGGQSEFNVGTLITEDLVQTIDIEIEDRSVFPNFDCCKDFIERNEWDYAFSHDDPITGYDWVRLAWFLNCPDGPMISYPMWYNVVCSDGSAVEFIMPLIYGLGPFDYWEPFPVKFNMTCYPFDVSIEVYFYNLRWDVCVDSNGNTYDCVSGYDIAVNGEYCATYPDCLGLGKK